MQINKRVSLISGITFRRMFPNELLLSKLFHRKPTLNRHEATNVLYQLHMSFTVGVKNQNHHQAQVTQQCHQSVTTTKSRALEETQKTCSLSSKEPHCHLIQRYFQFQLFCSFLLTLIPVRELFPNIFASAEVPVSSLPCPVLCITVKNSA